MALGTVKVRNLNLGQGAVSGVERYFLFIGPAAKNAGGLLPLNTDSDLDVELGAAVSDLKTQILAARTNGGDSWACLAAPLASDSTWQLALTQALQAGYEFEAVVVTTPVTAAAELSAMNDAAVQILNTYASRTFFIAASVGINKATQTWAKYALDQKALVKDLSAPRVLVVPQLHGNDMGVLAGRLADASVSVADSPMRVATGAVLGLGVVPTDSEGVPLQSSTRATLDASRYTVTQTYTGYPGVFFGDGNMLDSPDSDFKVIEYLRITDKAARAVRPLLIRRVADRRLNNSANSMAVNISALMEPLRRMAKSTTFAGQVFPGEIEQPKDGDIVLTWTSKTAVEAFIKLKPLNCPKDLTANIALDLSTTKTE
ncbi:DUF2586 family protein [Pseudomonas asturiensis]|uniref:DUF2586 family protein n=1 Tax=Pseudomonas asturiensis TaxID=1190415 RepID=A0ABX6H6Q6_9PSED|nr:DUF2586 domain-containing protein [Pseudomonas asturiensis]QHF01224.1 DUF2586 family protein [Pseudomonas asturiensis]